MGDYPDFAKYKIPRLGAPRVEVGSFVITHDDLPPPVTTFTGIGFLQHIEMFINGVAGGRTVRVLAGVDGLKVIDKTYYELFDRGLTIPGKTIGGLTMFDIENGNFSLSYNIPASFETSIIMAGWHFLGFNVTMNYRIYYAELE